VHHQQYIESIYPEPLYRGYDTEGDVGRRGYVPGSRGVDVRLRVYNDEGNDNKNHNFHSQTVILDIDKTLCEDLLNA
jgi:hypothetical protein